MDYTKLHNATLFRGLSPDEIVGIMHNTPFRTRRFIPGQFVAYAGERVNSMMIVIKGSVKGEMTGYSGRIIKIEEVPAPGSIAVAFLFGNRNILPVNVIALEDAEIMFIEKSVFLKLLRNHDRILVNFLDMISNRSQFLSEKIKFLNFKTIKGKLAQFILQQAGSSATSIKFQLTQADIADLFGVTRPSVARTLKEMEDEGLIIATGKSVTLLDREGLSFITGN